MNLLIKEKKLSKKSDESIASTQSFRDLLTLMKRSESFPQLKELPKGYVFRMEHLLNHKRGK